MREEKLSRLLFVCVLICWLVMAIISRLLTKNILGRVRRRGWNLRSAAIVGTGRLGQTFLHVLKASQWTGIVPHYFVGDPSKRKNLLGLEVCGPSENIEEILSQRPVDIVFVSVSRKNHETLETIVSKLASTNVDVRVVPDLLSFHFLGHGVTQLGNMPIITLTHSPQHGWNSLTKRISDMTLSSLLILLFALPMLIIALIIKLTSKGSVFYCQQRTSLVGKPFRIIKFRTMVTDAENDTGPTWATPDDPRVTRFGKFLRRGSLDELPQLFNVFAGYMSLVGPRPERPELIERFRKQIPGYMQRHQVKAGLTGWAQVHGFRGQSSLRKRIQYDLYYITNWSFWLDMRILLMTPFRGLINANAY